MTNKEVELGIQIIEMQYKLSPQDTKKQVLRFYAVANISTAEPIHETMPYKLVEYMYLAKNLLGLKREGTELEPIRSPEILDIDVKVSEQEIWQEIRDVYYEDYKTKNMEDPSDTDLDSKVSKLRKFLGGELEITPPKSLLKTSQEGE